MGFVEDDTTVVEWTTSWLEAVTSRPGSPFAAAMQHFLTSLWIWYAPAAYYGCTCVHSGEQSQDNLPLEVMACDTLWCWIGWPTFVHTLHVNLTLISASVGLFLGHVDHRWENIPADHRWVECVWCGVDWVTVFFLYSTNTIDRLRSRFHNVFLRCPCIRS